MKIGIYDSGIGGLSVLHRAKKMLPDAEFVYYADEEHVPYGEKKRSDIKRYVKEILDFLIEQGVDAVVIACNTATSVAEKEFRNTFAVPIVGMEPAVKKALKIKKEKDKRVLVTATPVTITGHKLSNLLEEVDADHEVDLLPLRMLVRYAETTNFTNPEIDAYLEEEFSSLDTTKYESVVLGCTHFNYFKKHLRRALSDEVHFVDGNEGTIKQLMRVMPKEQNPYVSGKVTYYFSGKEVNEEEYKKIERCLQQLDEMYDIV